MFYKCEKSNAKSRKTVKTAYKNHSENSNIAELKNFYIRQRLKPDSFYDCQTTAAECKETLKITYKIVKNSKSLCQFFLIKVLKKSLIKRGHILEEKIETGLLYLSGKIDKKLLNIQKLQNAKCTKVS